MELKKYKLGEYIDSFGDGIHGTPQYDDKGEYFFINGNNLKDGKIIITKDTLKITAREFEKIKRQIKPHNTVLVSINGTLGNVALYEDEKIALGKSACYLNLKNPAYRMFLRYILETNDFKKYMNRIAGQSTIKNVSPTQIAEYEFFAPDFPFQEKIGAVLSIIDNKITLNKRLSAKLEQMAKRLYDYWFVQFDFPDSNGEPYKSSGGKMVWNEKLKREIPCGWSAVPLKNLCKIVLGGTPKTEIDSYWNGNINWLNSGEVAQFPVITSEIKITPEGINHSATTLMPRGAVIVSITGNIRTSYLAIESCANQSVVGVLESNIMKKNYLYPAITDMIGNYIRLSTGNCQQHINKGTIENTLIILPDDSILKAYYQITDCMFASITNNAIENQQLSKLRDCLLPMLMNGQVEI